MLDPHLKGGLAVIVGVSGGIGAALAAAMLDRGEADHVVGLSRHRPWPDDLQRTWFAVDLENEASLATAAVEVAALGAPKTLLIASGMLQRSGVTPERTYRALSQDALARLFAVNATGPAMIAKHFLPLMSRTDRGVFAALSARVGSIGDNQLGGWYGYRASKAALNMLVHTLAVELRRTHPHLICVALHPGTVRTDLSQPFVRASRAAVLEPDESAKALLDVLGRLRFDDSGGFFGWNGAPIVW